MINVVDEILEDQAKYRILDSNGNVLYDNVSIELATQVQTQGTPLNKALFDSIQDDLDTRLLISSKATQLQAETGSENTRYMTPLRVKQYHNKNVGIKISTLNLSSSANNPIDLSTYLTSNVEKLEILINCRFTASSSGIILSGTGMRSQRGGKYSNSVTNPVTIGDVSTVDNVRAILQIYPNILTYNFMGNIGGTIDGSNQNKYFNIVGGFDTLETLTLGKRDIDSRNYEYQVAIYQYLQ